MDVLQAIRERKSIRGYKGDPIPEDAIKELLSVAVRSPSSRNTQPWHMTVVLGSTLDEIRKGNLEMLSVAAPGPERPLEGRYRERQIEQAQQLFALLGIDREDKEKRQEWIKQGARYFNAPAVIFLSVDETMGDRTPYLDCGLLAQTICLAALNFGLGTCILGAGIRFPDIVRRVTGIPLAERLITCICVGYPDWTLPVNRMSSKRDPIDETVRWVK